MPKNAHAPASDELLSPLHSLVQESRANGARLRKRLQEGKLNSDQLAAEVVDTVMSLITDGFEKVYHALNEVEDWADKVDGDVQDLMAEAAEREEEGDEPALLPEQATELKMLLFALLAEVPQTSAVREALQARVDKQVKFLDEITMTEEPGGGEEDDEDTEEEDDDEDTEEPPAVN